MFDRATATAFVAHLLDQGAEPATARARQLGIRRFSAWLTIEGEYDVDPLLGLVSPKLDTKVIEPLSDDELKALNKTCAITRSGSSATAPADVFRNRRDEAILRFMIETGARAGEVVAITLEDLPTKGRTVPMKRQCAACEAEFDARRRDARFCSPKCRKDAWQRGGAPAPSPSPFPGHVERELRAIMARLGVDPVDDDVARAAVRCAAVFEDESTPPVALVGLSKQIVESVEYLHDRRDAASVERYSPGDPQSGLAAESVAVAVEGCRGRSR